MTHGDNVSTCHDLATLIDEPGHILAYCRECRRRFYVKPQDRKRYNELFKRLHLQPGGRNLYWKYYGRMATV